MITGKIRCIYRDDGDIKEFQFLASDGTLWSRFMGPGTGASPQGIIRLDNIMYEDYDSVMLDKELTLDKWLVLTEGKSVSDLTEYLGVEKIMKGFRMLEPLKEAYDRCSGTCEECPIKDFCRALSDGLDIKSWFCGLDDMNDKLKAKLDERLEAI